MMRMGNLLLCIISLAILLASCNSKEVGSGQIARVIPSQNDTVSTPTQVDEIILQTEESTLKFVGPYTDIRYFDWFESKKIYEESEYNEDDIITFTFNQGTILKGSEDKQAQIMENGKNPGLGIKTLHAEGVTGKGVNVAIIDQNLLLNHPEFSGKITAYYDTGCDQNENSGSMHAPAVTSLLVGNTIGVAPDAKVYYAAVPMWLGDSEFFARGLYWIIEENKKLPDKEKIHVVSVSATPSGNGSPFTKNLNLWDKAILAAQEEGILVLDCRDGYKTGIITSAFYDPTDPDNVFMCTGGYPTLKSTIPATQIGAPASYRTVAEEYWDGSPSYQYTGQAGRSWAIPYAAGVLALGWQINPNLDIDQIIQILFDTCAIAHDGSNIINPIGFIDAVKAV